MKKIGNIIYKDDLVNHEKVDYIFYVKYSDKIEYDHTLPTLYVGWNFFKPKIRVINNIEPSILEKEHIKNKVYWEFSFSENKSEHINGINLFINNTPYYFFFHQYVYKNIDCVFYKIQSIDDLSELIKDGFDSFYNYKNEMIYVKKENEILGFDLIQYKFFGFKNESIIKILMDKSKFIKVDIDGTLYQEYYKIFPNFDFIKRYIIVLLSNR